MFSRLNKFFKDADDHISFVSTGILDVKGSTCSTSVYICKV